jgi:GNAT superfamily N-acetyltransferase
MEYRSAKDADLPLLARWNRHLIEDEGHSNPMTLAQLQERMRLWLDGPYQATMFLLEERAVAYALWRRDPEGVYLRHFFVDRAHRRRGVGGRALAILLSQVFPRGARVVVECLVGNARGLAFWRSIGFTDYSLTLHASPPSDAERL